VATVSDQPIRHGLWARTHANGSAVALWHNCDNGPAEMIDDDFAQCGDENCTVPTPFIVERATYCEEGR
jgi:hypothetical protein